MFTLIRFIKKVSKFGKVRRIVEIPKEYYKVVKAGQKVIIEIEDKRELQ